MRKPIIVVKLSVYCCISFNFNEKFTFVVLLDIKVFSRLSLATMLFLIGLILFIVRLFLFSTVFVHAFTNVQH